MEELIIDFSVDKETKHKEFYIYPDDVFMQYTGIKDKKGVKIYEGDILIAKAYPFYGNTPEIKSSNQKCDELNYVGIVVWDNGYYLDLHAVSNRVRGHAVGSSLYDYKNVEIIGNRYENPELMEAKND